MKLSIVALTAFVAAAMAMPAPDAAPEEGTLEKRGQGCPSPWNTCGHHCKYEVETDMGTPCGGECQGFTCVCLYGSAC